MRKISVLDCTLRDGGYCNKWDFGNDNIKKIITRLTDVGMDIIECGFLTKNVVYDQNITKYTTMQEVINVIPKERKNKLFVCMINYGEYNLEDIPEYEDSYIDGLRVAFHKEDMIPALEFCKGIKEKGYKVFIQAMVSLSYSDKEFLELIELVNQFEPYSFYIVDSFGVMKNNDLIRLFYMTDHNLKENVIIGYHSHNNMQLAFSNAQALTDISTKRDIIIDTSVFGMGRGAGNLNTELFVEYLNNNFGTSYDLRPLLNIIDEILNTFYKQNYWGYSLPNYLSAKHNSHPNYANYLESKNTLTVENMNEIFMMMDDSKRVSYDEVYIENLYVEYMNKDHVQEKHLLELKEKITGKNVLIIAPGHSSKAEKNKIFQYTRKKNLVTISINFNYMEFETDFIFVSNLRRFRELDRNNHNKCIITSNISATDVYLQTKYSDLLNRIDVVCDNSSLMLIKYLIELGAKKVLIAGLDGYSLDPTQNFIDKKMNFFAKKDVFNAMNEGITKVLKEYREQIDIEFVTTPKYVLI